MHNYIDLRGSSQNSIGMTLVNSGGQHMPIEGTGTCRFTLPPRPPNHPVASPPNVWNKFSTQPDGPECVVLPRVKYAPLAKFNVISWSSIRENTPDAQLIEEADGSLIVWDRGLNRVIMRFEMKGGLFFLVQPRGRSQVELPEFVR